MTGLRNLRTARVAIYKDLCGFCTKLPKAQPEATKNHREQQRNWPFAFRFVSLAITARPSVLSVGFLRVLCVKFRKARPTICAPCKHFDAIPWPNTRSPLPCGRESTMLRVYG